MSAVAILLAVVSVMCARASILTQERGMRHTLAGVSMVLVVLSIIVMFGEPW